MNCPFNKDRIQDYIDDRLSPEERIQVEAHLGQCPECHREWVEMNNLKQLLWELPNEELPEGFREELHEKLEAVVQTVEPPKGLRLPKLGFRKHFRAYSAVAAVLVVGVVSLNMLNRGGLTNLARSADEAQPEMYAGAMPAEAPMAPDDAKLKAVAPRVTFTGDSSSEFEANDTVSMDLTNAEWGATGSGTGDGTAVQPTAGPVDTVQQRKVIYTGAAFLETLQYDKTLEAITQQVNGMGGYVESMSTGDQYTPMAGEKALKSGSITIRVPQAQFQGMFKALEAYGRVSSVNMSSEDISAQYRDTYNQAVNLEVREKKLREIMDKAVSVQDVLAVEGELSRVRGEINSLKGTLQQWDQLVSLSRITINITEVRSLEGQVQTLDENLASRIWKAFTESVNSVLESGENLLVNLVGALPWLTVGAVVLVPAGIMAKRKGWIRRIKR